MNNGGYFQCIYHDHKPIYEDYGIEADERLYLIHWTCLTWVHKKIRNHLTPYHGTGLILEAYPDYLSRLPADLEIPIDV